MLTNIDLTLAYLSRLALLGLVAALVVRRLYKVCLCLALYATCSIVYNVLGVTWPDRFWTWPFYVTDRAISSLFKFGLAIEVSERVFRAFPGARATIRRLVAFGSAVFVGIALGAIFSGAPLHDLTVHFFARLALITGMTFAVLWLLSVWYHVPMHPLHRAIIRGFAFLTVVQALTFALVELSWDLRRTTNYVEQTVLLLAMSYIGWVAWRSPVGYGRKVPQRLQPS